MAHGDAITDADGGKFNRRASGRGYAEFDGLGDFPEMDMAGDDFVKRVNDADQRFGQVFIGIAHGME